MLQYMQNQLIDAESGPAFGHQSVKSDCLDFWAHILRN